MIELCDRALCTGCQSCLNSCPKVCITMETESGYSVPSIDGKQCIGCGKCRTACPVLNPIALKTPDCVFAAVCLNETDYKASTSGGIATLLAKNIVRQNGVIYGAAFVNQALGVCHIRAESPADLERLRGSKYVQSVIGTTYRQVLTDLRDGRPVLFIGTPCQVAGLYGYLQTPFERLFTIDLICHGTPPYSFLKEHLEKRVKKYDQLNFRCNGKYKLSTSVCGVSNYKKDRFLDGYYLSFLKGISARQSCYSCRYATDSRCGDITLGDFWGYRGTYHTFPSDGKDGLSLVMLNSTKGKELFADCQKEMACEQRTLEEAIQGNKQLRHPSVPHRNREKFLALYQKKGFDYAANHSLYLERVVYGLLYLLEQVREKRNRRLEQSK